MYRIAFLIVFLSISFRIYFDYRFHHESPDIPSDDYFGEGMIQADDEELSEFSVQIGDGVIENLKMKVKEDSKYFMADAAEEGSSYAKKAAYIENITSHFDKFNWKQHQYFLNTFQQYRTEVEGLKIHFARAVYRQTYKRIVPLLLLHDWPTSFWSYYKVIPILSNPSRFGFEFGVRGQIAFDAVIPSVPGMGFSESPVKPGFGLIESARILCKLMSRLSTEQFFVHGTGEFGSSLGTAVTLICPAAVRGLHLVNPSMKTFHTRQTQIASAIQTIMTSIFWNNFTSPQKEIDSLFEIWPDSLEMAYRSSLFGTVSLMMESWAKSTDPRYEDHSIAELHKFFTVDELLTNAVLCWLTNTVPQGIRLFKNTMLNPTTMKLFRASVLTPTAILVTPDAAPEMTQNAYQFRYFNITQFNQADSGGNYYALQKPPKFAEDIFSFVEKMIG